MKKLNQKMIDDLQTRLTGLERILRKHFSALPSKEINFEELWKQIERSPEDELWQVASEVSHIYTYNKTISHWKNLLEEVESFIQFFQDEKNCSNPELSKNAISTGKLKRGVLLKAIKDLEDQQFKQYEKARKALDYYNPNPRLYDVNFCYYKKKRNKSVGSKDQEISFPLYCDYLEKIDCD